jgi:hypothetical protein
MFDALLAKWMTAYNSIMKSPSTTNSTSTQPSQTHAVDIQSLSSTSTAPAATTAGWTVTSQSGGDESIDLAQKLEDMLNRTVTRPILSDVIYRPIIAAIVLASTFALWKKIRSPNGTSKISWRDALGLALIGSCVSMKWMLEAIALTAAYVAWSSLADRSWNSTGKLPDFEAFLASLRLAGTTTTTNATMNPSPSDDDSATAPPGEATPTSSTSPAPPTPESAILSQFEAQLGLPERKPSEECVVCWTSDEDPLRLPCLHLVCSDCLTRLRDSQRSTCPYCSTPLFKLKNNKNLLHQLAVATSAAHLAICLTEAALKIVVHRQYFGALFMLSFNLPSALLGLYAQYQVAVRWDRGVTASASESLLLQCGVSLFMAHASYGRVPDVDWANFFDGKWRRWRTDEWDVVRRVVCWAVPGLAGQVVRCPVAF